jgi:Lrp/AsnC family transcriptional regulator for asnA, asnC and gidA
MEKLDEFDIQIIKELEKDGRIAYSTIATNLKISNTMVHQRINKLTEQGILAGIRPIINEKKSGLRLGGFYWYYFKQRPRFRSSYRST